MDHQHRKRESNLTNIPDDILERMETAFHADFSNVRVSEGSAASAIGAIAFARGADIHFAPGRYQPHTAAGQEVLGHELAHVVQQHEGRASGVQAKGLPILVDDAHEHEADEVGARAARGEAVASRQGPLRIPARSSGGVMQAMFDLDGSTYQVLQTVGVLNAGDVVTASSNSVFGFTVIRKSDGANVTVPHPQAIPANFQKLVHVPGDVDYLMAFSEPSAPYYKQGPNLSNEPAKTISKHNKKQKVQGDTFKSTGFQSVPMTDVDFSTLSFPQASLPEQKTIDRAALSLLDEAMKLGLAYIEPAAVDALDGRTRQVVMVADIWTGKFYPYTDLDKDHLFNQAEIMSNLKKLEVIANQDEFSLTRVRNLLQLHNAGTLVQKPDKSWAITQGTVDAQYSSTKNLAFSSAALNRRRKNDQDVFDTIDGSVVQQNTADNFDGASMVGKDGKTIGETLKKNLTSGDNKRHLAREKGVREVHTYMDGQSTKVRFDQAKAKQLRGKNDPQADKHETSATTRDRKLYLERRSIKTLCEQVDSSEDEDMSDLETMVPRNMEATIEGIRGGEEVDIAILQATIEDRDETVQKLKDQLSDTEAELEDVQRERDIAVKRVAELESELDGAVDDRDFYKERETAAKIEVMKLSNENDELRAQLEAMKQQLAKVQQ